VITTWRPRPVAYRLLSAGIPALAPARSKHLWLTPPGAAEGARLRVWEYEGGALDSARRPDSRLTTILTKAAADRTGRHPPARC